MRTTLFLVVVVVMFVAKDAWADGGPALHAYYPKYNQSDGVPQHFGARCFNDPAAMPPGRAYACGAPTLVTTDTGRYTITVTNGTPFPTAGTEDSGHMVQVAAVGSNAHCFEETTSWSGNNLTST